MISNNSSSTRLQSTHSQKTGSATNKDEKDLYESVLHRNYQIIQTFLQKINSLYIKNQQFEVTLNAIQDRLDKIESTTSNIHYEFRTTHLMMDKRLNSITSDFSNINQQIRMLRQELPADSYLSTQNLLAKSAFIKNRKGKNDRRLQSNNSIVPKVVVKEADEGQKKQEKQSKIGTSWNLGAKMVTSLSEFHRISQTCKVIFPDNLESHMDTESESYSKQQEVSCSQEKKKQKEAHSLLKSQKFGVIYDKQWVENEIGRQIDEFTAKLNTFTEQWNQEKAKLKAEIFGHEMQNHLSSFQSKMDEKLGHIKDLIYFQQEKMSKDIKMVNETSLKYIGALQYKLAQKVQNSYFQESMNNLSSAISLELANNQKHYSNKQETQRAIRFLENKINKIIEEQQYLNSSAMMKSSKDAKGDQEPCLRINKCKSLKKTDLPASQKNINLFKSQQCEPTKTLNNYHSLNASSADIDKYERPTPFKQNKENSANPEPRKINWKSMSSDVLNSFKIQSDTKIRKASIISKATPVKNRSSYSNFVPEQRVNEKEWKQKVVKILNKGDRKRVKVTFH